MARPKQHDASVRLRTVSDKRLAAEGRRIVQAAPPKKARRKNDPAGQTLVARSDQLTNEQAVQLATRRRHSFTALKDRRPFSQQNRPFPATGEFVPVSPHDMAQYAEAILALLSVALDGRRKNRPLFHHEKQFLDRVLRAYQAPANKGEAPSFREAAEDLRQEAGAALAMQLLSKNSGPIRRAWSAAKRIPGASDRTRALRKIREDTELLLAEVIARVFPTLPDEECGRRAKALIAPVPLHINPLSDIRELVTSMCHQQTPAKSLAGKWSLPAVMDALHSGRVLLRDDSSGSVAGKLAAQLVRYLYELVLPPGEWEMRAHQRGRPPIPPPVPPSGHGLHLPSRASSTFSFASTPQPAPSPEAVTSRPRRRR